MKKILSISAILALSLNLSAATATTNFNVTATVASSCQINSASELAFGTYDPLSATDVESTNTISITCSNGTAYSVGLDGGSSTDVNGRTMEGGTDSLSYAIYSDAAKTTIWGNTVGTDTIDGTSSSSSSTIDLTGYGVLTAGQDVVPDNYTDTIVATVTY